MTRATRATRATRPTEMLYIDPLFMLQNRAALERFLQTLYDERNNGRSWEGPQRSVCHVSNTERAYVPQIDEVSNGPSLLMHACISIRTADQHDCYSTIALFEQSRYRRR